MTFATFGVIAAICLTALKGKFCSGIDQVSLALILGGAMGNLIDRVRLGAVIDFLDFRIWPVFNVADSCITVGVILTLLRLLRK